MSSMKKIVFVAPFVHPGGTEIALLRLFNHLPEGRFDVTIILLRSDPMLVQMIPEWIHIRYAKVQGYKQFIKNAMETEGILGAVYAIYRVIKNKLISKYDKNPAERTGNSIINRIKRYEHFGEIYDVAISWGLPKSIENAYVSHQVKAKKKAMWIHLDTLWDDLYDGSNVILKKYDSIVCVSESCRNSFIQQHPENAVKTRVLYNIMDAKQIKEKSTAAVSDIPQAGMLLVTCGRLSKEKNPEYSITIANELIRKGITDFKWIFVGGDENIGDHFSQLIKAHHLEGHLILMGFKDNPYPYVKQADLYVQLSMHESYCMALAEAQILGIPAVTTNFPSAYEIVEDGKTGLIVQQSPEDVCEGIERLLRHPALLREMSANLMQRELSSVGHVDDFIRFIDTL